MATEKQIAANRANGSRSKGPKTLAGKRRASRNAFLHGLSKGAPLAIEISQIVNKMIAQVQRSGAITKPDKMAAFVEAHRELQVIRELRLTTKEICELDDSQLWRLAALDRYESRAITKRKKAAKQLDDDQIHLFAERTQFS